RRLLPVGGGRAVDPRVGPRTRNARRAAVAARPLRTCSAPATATPEQTAEIRGPSHGRSGTPAAHHETHERTKHTKNSFRKIVSPFSLSPVFCSGAAVAGAPEVWLSATCSND